MMTLVFLQGFLIQLVVIRCYNLERDLCGSKKILDFEEALKVKSVNMATVTWLR